jgi:polyisoprenoid-binding protein YceI
MASTTVPLSGTYTADPVHSNFQFSVPYQGVSIFRGSLSDVEAKLEDGVLEGRAKVESISIRSPEQFRAHVLSEEFFDAENHPEVIFRSTELNLREDGTADLKGELTIKGITKPVEATGTWQPAAGDAFGNQRAHLHLEAKIDRTQFDMNWNLPLPSGEKALAHEVTLTIDLSLIQQQ